MDDYMNNYPEVLVKDLQWSRKYHLMLIRAIDRKLIELSKKYELTVPLE